MPQSINNDLETKIIMLTARIAKKDQELEKLKEVIKSFMAYAEIAQVSLPPLPNQTVKACTQKVLKGMELKMMPDASSATRGEEIVHLTTREFKILAYLNDNLEKTCTRETLISQFNNEMDMTERNIDVHIFSLRKKLHKLEVSIETVWGLGYKLSY